MRKLRVGKVGAQNIFIDFLAKLNHSKEMIFFAAKNSLKRQALFCHICVCVWARHRYCLGVNHLKPFEEKLCEDQIWLCDNFGDEFYLCFFWLHQEALKVVLRSQRII